MKIIAFLTMLATFGCNDSDNGGQGGAIDASNDGLAGSLVLQLEPAEGASPDSVKGANLQVDDRPEMTALADDSGKLIINAVLPGSLNIIVTSAEQGAGLVQQGAEYGIRITDVVVKAGEPTDLGTKTMKRTGSVSGSISYLQNSDSIEKLGAEVFIPGTSFMAKTDDSGKFSITGIPEGSYEIAIRQTGFATSRLKDVVVAEGADTAVGTIILSLALGPEGSVSIHGSKLIKIGGADKHVVTSRTVNAAIVYDADAELMKVSDEPSFLNKQWAPVQDSVDWTYESDGEKALYVMFSDLNGLESSPYATEFIVDTEAPVLSAVKILNGWPQTAGDEVFADIESSDTGTGMAEFIVSHVSGDFSNGESWATFKQRIETTLVAGTGEKTVYFKVKDFTGNESNVVSDSISLSTTSIISQVPLSDAITIESRHSPYRVAENVEFTVPVTIEKGVVIDVDGNIRIDFKNVVKAAGESGSEITFRATGEPSSCMSGLPFLDFDNAVAGVSAANQIEYVIFSSIDTVSFNGGKVINSTFSNGNCGSSRGSIYKNGFDKLSLSNNTFDEWQAIYVKDGDGVTSISENSGVIYAALTQSGSSTRTVYVNNSLEVSSSVYLIQSGEFTPTNNTWTGSAGNGILTVHNGSTATMKTDDFSGLTGSMNQAIIFEDSSTVVVSNVDLSGVTGSQYSVGSNGGSGIFSNIIFSDGAPLFANTYSAVSPISLSFEHVEVNADQNFVSNYGLEGFTLSITNSNIIIDNVAGSSVLDFLERQFDATATAIDNITMQSNNITCLGTGLATTHVCRGFSVRKTTTGDVDYTLNLNLTNNYWVTSSLDHKIPNTDMDSNVVSAGWDDYNATNNQDEVRLYKVSQDAGQTEHVNTIYNVTQDAPLGTPVAGAGVSP